MLVILVVGKITCPNCNRGSVTCSTCRGSGKSQCGGCTGAGKKACSKCNGSGTNKVSYNCTHGNGPDKSHYYCSKHGNAVSQYH